MGLIIKKDLNHLTKKIDDYLFFLDKIYTYLENDFKKKYFEFYRREYLSGIRNPIKVQNLEFNELFDLVKSFLKRQKNFMKKIMDLDYLNSDSKLSVHTSELVNRFNNDVLSYESLNFGEIYDSNSIYFFMDVLYRIDLEERYSSILLLIKFSECREDIVLIGGNGSGKSSLANFLKGDEMNDISVIPAQKNLYYSNNDFSLLKTERMEIERALLENNIRKMKSDPSNYDFFNYQNNQFSKLIIAMQSEYTSYLYECDKENVTPKSEETVFGKLKEIFKVVFPGIALEFDPPPKYSLNCIKDGNSYQVNALSEGEKVVIFYSISVLLAKKKSFIIVDEPETYMNPALTNLVWDTLTKMRGDCQFIFITHSINFVLGRTNAKIAWIKNYKYPGDWEFEFLEEGNGLPKNLLTEILGSAKPVLFCEGDDKSSLDYHIYKAIFGEKYSIIPVNGHRQVIDYCRAVNKLGKTEVAYGLIDGDNNNLDAIKKYSEDNIFVLPFNEVEMLLIEENIINEFMKIIYPEGYQNRVEIFKNEIWKLVQNRKEIMILDYVKKCIDEYIEKEKIDRVKDLEEIKKSLLNISVYDVENLYSKRSRQLNKIIENRKYSDLLKICNLKKEITRGLANKFLDSDYEEKIKQQIISNDNLRDYINKTYFNFL